MTIEDEIRILCAKKKISQAELARRIGQSPQNLNAKVRRGTLSDEELGRIAEVLGVEFKRNFIYSDENNK